MPWCVREALRSTAATLFAYLVTGRGGPGPPPPGAGHTGPTPNAPPRRDKLNRDIFWLKDASATDPDSLPPPAEIAAEIVDSLELALEKFRGVAIKLGAATTAE